MAAFLITNVQDATGRLPFIPMRQDSFSAGTELCEQMRELMTKGPIDFFRAMIPKQGI